MPFIQTLSGKHFDYNNIRHDDIVIEDVARALSNICRFTGHLPEFYSVAQHSFFSSFLVPHEYALEALLHDASEAYCQDIPAPLKRLLPDYRSIENKVETVIREKFGLPYAKSLIVKQADLIMLATERRDLGIDDGTPWPCLEGVSATTQITITPVTPKVAERLFMSRYVELITNK